MYARPRRGVLLFASLIANNLGLPSEQASSLIDEAREIARLLGACRGRGCDERGLAAAIVYYLLRRRGLRVEASSVYSRIRERIEWLRIPRQTFHNSLRRVLASLGHSSLFRRVLLGRLGARVCRVGLRVEWELYGPGPPPPCSGLVEEWPGPSPPVRILYWGGGMKVRVGRVTFDASTVIARLQDVFGGDWFTAREAAVILAVTPRTASALLRKLEAAGLVESRQSTGRNMKEYRLTGRWAE